MQQEILCIDSESLFSKGKWNGLKTTDLDYYYDLLLTKSQFRVRSELENDPNYKQIIPQVILKYKDAYFLHKQLSANEVRLNNFCPLPLGGHVEKFDLNAVDMDVIQAAIIREVDEEAVVKSTILTKIFMGIIYLEDENLVNHMHVGLLYVFDLAASDVKMRADGLETVGWVDKNYLTEHLHELTYWSRIFVTECL